MNESSDKLPTVLSLSSHDPSGSTGVQADIETCMSLGVHCCAVITALCARDTQRMIEMVPTSTSLLIEQTRAILEDMPVTAIKLGYFCKIEQIEALHSILLDYPDIPVVLDPVLSLSIDGDAGPLIDRDDKLAEALLALLLPMASLITPDIVEAHRLAREADTADACAQQLLSLDCRAALITGSLRNSEQIVNSLYMPGQQPRRYSWPRLNLFAHGSGATLSASISAYLAHGLHLRDAVLQGQQFTWNSLNASRRLGKGYSIPNRLFWSEK